MIILRSESELMSCFREMDQAEVELPRDLKFPLKFEDAYTWLESSGARAYLMFQDHLEGLPKGIVFYRSAGPFPDVPAMCDWCHSVRANGAVRILSAKSSLKKRVGLNLCSDLSCVEKARALPGPHDLPEGLGDNEKVKKIVARMSRFAASGLF
jgi:hypothetical protein